MIDNNGGGSTWIGYHDRSAEAGCTDNRHQGIGGEIEATGNEDRTEIWRSGQDWNDANCDGTKPYICGYITDGSGSDMDMCSGERPTDAGGDQLITFGCIDHETVPCTYNANAAGGDYATSMAAFSDCHGASVGVTGYRGELSAASGLSNQNACGGPNTNIAFHTLIPFTAACEGVYQSGLTSSYGFTSACESTSVSTSASALKSAAEVAASLDYHDHDDDRHEEMVADSCPGSGSKSAPAPPFDHGGQDSIVTTRTRMVMASETGMATPVLHTSADDGRPVLIRDKQSLVQVDNTVN
jgi:hypothetical protein